MVGMEGGMEGYGDMGHGGHPMMGGDDYEEGDDDAPGEGAADGSQVTRLVDLTSYDDGYKWRK
jgi:hypothetical protein